MRPPIFARTLVRVFSDAEDRAFLLEDLADRFSEIARTEGQRAAKRWYWSQALSVLRWALRPDGAWIRRWSGAGVVGDLRLGLRTLCRSPLYATGVAGTLGLGMAAAMVTFAVAWRVWLAPMPYPEPDRVVRLYEIEPAGPTPGAPPESRRQPLSPTLLEDFRAHSWRTIEAVSAVVWADSYEWSRDRETRSISGVYLSPDGFEILGILPILGRLPSEPEREILLTERFWRTAFGGDPSVVGSEMDLGNGALPVVGVARLPSGYPRHADIVRVIDYGETEDRGWRPVEAIARIGPEHSVAAAKAEMNAFVAALAEIHPEHREWSADAVVLADDLMRPFRGVLALLLAVGTTFLMLAGANVMGLVAARRVEGRRDRSIRLALGASEGRLLRGSLTESLLLAGVGSLAGGLSAYWLIGPIRAMVPQDVPRLADVAVTPPLVLGGLGIGMALGLAIGACGYLVSRGAKPSVGRAPVWRAFGSGGRRALVVGQVALTTLLTSGGAAILHRVSTLRAIELGYDPEPVSTTSTFLGEAGYPGSESRWAFSRTVLEELDARAIPAATAFNTPISEDGDKYGMPRLSMRADSASEEIVYDVHPVSPGYFSVMGIDLLTGRDFGLEDHASSQRVVIVSEEFVDQYFPTGTPVEGVVGRVIAPLPYDTTGPTVVGVVRSTRHYGPDSPVEPEIYWPLSQEAFLPVTLLVRGEPEEVADGVSAVLAQVDPDLRWTPLIQYTRYLKQWFAPLRLQLNTIGVLGVLGLVLAALGLYSLMAYQVATRRQELGIRKAVGATDGKLVRGVLASGLTMAALGALVGLGAWYQLLPMTRQFVEGIESAGYLVPISVALVVGCSSLLATALPAVRAMRVDPVVTLKAD